MDQHVSKLIPESLSQQFSLKEVLASYDNIELTDDEVTEALIWRKRKKEDDLRSQAQKDKEESNRKRLTAPTNYDIVKSLMAYRATVKFKGFVLDDNNSFLFELLCRYFGNDQQFISIAVAAGVQNPSLDKGIFLAGNFGVGKTWFMKLFQTNQRQVYQVKNCKEIAEEFMQFGEEGMDKYTSLKKNAINDSSAFFQTHTGLCLDDIGTEDIKSHYGNKKNVIGDLLEIKYDNKTTGIYLHATTNLTSEQLREFYGSRVTSRMREIFNFIELKGNDRRV